MSDNRETGMSDNRETGMSDNRETGMSSKKEMTDRVLAALKQASQEALHELDVATLNAREVNWELLHSIVLDCKDTEYGKKYHFAELKDVDDYRARVPMTTYADYEAYIARMAEHGETNLLTAYPVVYYASTSGTSGSPKKVPVSDRGLAVFRKYASSVMLAVISEYYRNTTYADAPSGLRMTLLSFSRTPLPCGVDFGSISAACMTDKGIASLPYILSTPPEVLFCRENADLKYLHARYGLAQRDIVYLSGAYIPAILDMANYILENWEMLVADIRYGRIDRGVQMPDTLRAILEASLKPDPERADELEAEFKKGFGDNILRRVWPKLSAVSAIWAGNFHSYARKIQNEFTGRAIPFYTMSYASSEGIFGVARHPFDQYYCLIPGSCFYEFIPTDVDALDAKESENPQTLLIDELEDGKEYELVITNQSGFYRYRMGDVVRVVGFYNEAPMVEFRYRKKNIVSIAGEKFTEGHLQSAIREFERRTGIDIVDYCMYPDRDVVPARYVILMEPEKVVPRERLAECERVIAEELARASTSYAHYVIGGNMGKPKLVFLQQQVFALYREVNMYLYGLPENQLKTPRVLSTQELINAFVSQAEPYPDAE